LRRIVALDPGGTTGVAILRLEEGQLLREVHQFGPGAHHRDLWNLLNAAYHYGQLEDGMLIVCESFEYRNRAREGLVLDSVKYIGVTELFADLHSCPVVFQSASMGKVGADDSKGFVRRKNLKKLEWPWTHELRHQADATGHALYYMIHNPTFLREDPHNAKIKSDLLNKGWR
jgi:hypothetical protein